MSRTWRRRAWLVPATFAVCLASCDASCQQEWAEVIRALAFLAMVVMVLAACCGVAAFTCVVGGIVTSILNLTGPSRRTKTLGITFAVINTLIGGVMVLGVVAGPPRLPPPTPSPPVYDEPTFDPTGDPFGQPLDAPTPTPPPTPQASGEGELDIPQILGGLVIGLGWLAVGVIGLVIAVRARAPGDAPRASPPGAPRVF